MKTETPEAESSPDPTVEERLGRLERGLTATIKSLDKTLDALSLMSDRLDQYHPQVRSCVHCNRQIPPGQKRCGICGKAAA